MEKMKKPAFLASEKFIDLLVLFVIFSFLLSYFKPDLILSKTTVTGGDTGSMIYSADYLQHQLLPQGRIIGWSPGRWLGYPIFHFQFPLPYLIAAILGYLIPLEISFKLITIAGILTLPLATYLMMKWMSFDFPTPIIASIFSLHFLFLEKNTVMGGSIPSVLAGEFSYSLSFSLMLLFMGYIYKSIDSGRFSIGNPILLTLVFFSHLVTTVAAGLSTLFFLLERNKKELKAKKSYLKHTCSLF
jgi:uncharacterized membrane protein